MDWVVGSGMVMGLLAVALGMVSIRTGWTPPWVRRRVTRPGVHGLAGLLVGALCVIQGLFYFHVVPSPSREVRSFGTGAFMFSVPILLGVSQMRPSRRRASEQTGQSDVARPS